MKKRLALMLLTVAVLTLGACGQGAASESASASGSASGQAAAEEAAPQAESITESADAQVATFELMENIAVTDSAFTPEEDYSFYLYSPSDPHNFDMMSGQLNPVVFVYPDQPYENQDAAYAALEDMGMIDIAENSSAYVIIPNPLNGESYTEDDLNVYYESQIYLAGGQIVSFTPPTGEYERRTYNNLQYIIAEGNGATFVNNVLSQNANRIAAVLTFGGEMDSDLDQGVALPAYLVNAADETVAYYQDVNETDSEPEDGHFVNSSYIEKQVYVAEGSDSFDKETIETAWDSLLSRLTRAPLKENVVINTADMSEWVLMSWPNYDELGLDLVSHTYSVEDQEYIAYDYVPESYTGDEAVPLVILLHGLSEDPLCPAATCGWAQKAAEEGFILIAPDYFNDLEGSGDAVPCVMAALEQAKATYNIDTTRIYLTGFSMGSMNTLRTGFSYPDVFAAIAPMSGPTDITAFAADATKYDLPVYHSLGTLDQNFIVEAEDGNSCINGAADIYPAIASFNGIELGEADYSRNIFGYTGTNSDTRTEQGYTYHFEEFYADGYTRPLVTLVQGDDIAHACSNVYADFAWEYISGFARGEDGSLIELDAQ